jgi:hypothetical protein
MQWAPNRAYEQLIEKRKGGACLEVELLVQSGARVEAGELEQRLLRDVPAGRAKRVNDGKNQLNPIDAFTRSAMAAIPGG